jgi:hypothetical protein
MTDEQKQALVTEIGHAAIAHVLAQTAWLKTWGTPVENRIEADRAMREAKKELERLVRRWVADGEEPAAPPPAIPGAAGA